uniref:Uncharacterized protein n=1 Tax=Synechocystis sp. PCC 9413 TaxID=77760 RepID=A0A2P0ZGJ3_9SYNC|nr:hypothetical protein [Synechocystis sp. PCC 9413]
MKIYSIAWHSKIMTANIEKSFSVICKVHFAEQNCKFQSNTLYGSEVILPLEIGSNLARAIAIKTGELCL